MNRRRRGRYTNATTSNKDILYLDESSATNPVETHSVSKSKSRSKSSVLLSKIAEDSRGQYNDDVDAIDLDLLRFRSKETDSLSNHNHINDIASQANNELSMHDDNSFKLNKNIGSETSGAYYSDSPSASSITPRRQQSNKRELIESSKWRRRLFRYSNLVCWRHVFTKWSVNKLDLKYMVFPRSVSRSTDLSREVCLWSHVQWDGI